MTRPALIPIATSLVIAVFSLSLAANSEFDEQYELDVQTYGVYQEFGSRSKFLINAIGLYI